VNLRARKHDETGASLILAIAFIVVIGAIIGATLTLLTSGLNQRNILDQARNREYAADAAINYAISQTRALPAPGAALSPCGPFNTANLNNFSIRVDCTNVPTTTFSGFLQRNVIFVACLKDGSNACGGSNNPVIIRAQVNFQGTGTPGDTVNITGTTVQSWSVLG
jgi:type II secretory pathway pseudopilin PulG